MWKEEQPNEVDFLCPIELNTKCTTRTNRLEQNKRREEEKQ
jgi:hypothetical protein